MKFLLGLCKIQSCPHVNAASEDRLTLVAVFVILHKQHHCLSFLWYCLENILAVAFTTAEGRYEVRIYDVSWKRPKQLEYARSVCKTWENTWEICPVKLSAQQDSFEFKFKFASHNTSGEKYICIYSSSLLKYNLRHLSSFIFNEAYFILLSTTIRGKYI